MRKQASNPTERAMNRITSYLSHTEITVSHPALKAERRLRQDAETLLRDMAFVLKMTQRIKKEMLEDNETSDAVTVCQAPSPTPPLPPAGQSPLLTGSSPWRLPGPSSPGRRLNHSPPPARRVPPLGELFHARSES